MRMRMAIAAAFLCVAATAARADDACMLKRVADLAIKSTANGDYVMPVTLDGKPQWFVIGLNAPFSVITGKFADAQGYTSHSLPRGISSIVRDDVVTQQTVVPDIALGPAHAKDFKMLRGGEHMARDTEIAGMIGLDLLANFDVELDLSHGHLRLFSQDHCEGKVVYWSDTSVVVPFHKDESGHFAIDMRLDGKDVTVDFVAAQGPALMPSRTSKRIFGLDVYSDGMVAQADGGETRYRYPFKSLSLGGIAISNPAIAIFPTNRECRPDPHDDNKARCYGQADLDLREAELRHLRLLFSFKEKKLYATAADAGADPAQQGHPP
jgi:predicted aspartyl protease